MPISVYEGEPFGECELVLELFYKKTHKEQYAKTIWSYVYKVLKDRLIDSTRFPLQGGGCNKLRLGLLNDDAVTAFLNAPLIEFRVAGILMKDERTGEWFNGLQGSDSESSLSASSTSSRQSAAS